jgi:Icc protein
MEIDRENIEDHCLWAKNTLEKNNSKEFRFIIIGDTKGKSRGINEKVLNNLLRIAKKTVPEPDFFVILGDCVAGSDKVDELRSQLERFKQMLYSYFPNRVVFSVIGNHEVNNNPVDDKAEKIFEEVFCEFSPSGQLEGFNKTVYYVDVENTRLIVLNSYHYGQCSRIGEEQLNWLKQIASEDKEHKFVFVHSPAYPTGAHIGSCLDKFLDDRDKFWKVIDESNVDIVFSGHEHNYSRRVIDKSFNTEKYQYKNSIYQIISGGGGEHLKDKFVSKKGVVVPPKDIYHFVVVDVERDLVKVWAVSDKEKVIDKFEIVKKY